ncbi:peptide chain release factor N(5)-glutamine methyltransferase [Mesorhizobium sp. LHD-90]|uniref:peptide chain release factor N(5)-glutamine methyltransferase n=1 Tax=Mesorhizobium sp. LHD-90 TaxID=3071414 RepID=UPI0027E030B0|nr:peptide chain release factor N(5)-glutamine methyltransferase [Mesorhizobium sp. LHD-90]MDQ6432819.1 peptide chain release factor N(5)-glutamine methyltransferase [Mesorhizobium sp. LHD-90]
MPDERPTALEDLLRVGREMFSAAGIDDPALDARLLVEHFTGTTRAHAIVSPRRPVEAAVAARVTAAFERRLAGEPVHRIIGFRAFYGLDLLISPATLEPRPDTETLVDAMLPFVRETAGRKGSCRILDLGTGTGAIALALLSEVEAAVATGVDVSRDALAAATENARRIGVTDRFTPLLSDWFENVSGRWDVIVSNPPYIPTESIAGLAREVRDHEPLKALDGGEDGLDAYRRIAGRAKNHLDADGRIGLEIGFDQKRSVTAVFVESGFVPAGSAKDLGGNDRVLIFATKTSRATGI